MDDGRQRAPSGRGRWRATCTVDAALFDNLKQAVEFVTERGGGVVYTELAGTKFAESMKLPENVQLKPRRVEDVEKDQAA